MKMIGLTIKGGKQIWMNTDKIWWVTSDDNGETQVYIGPDRPSLDVEGSVFDVMSTLLRLRD